ncbi:MAG: hypothetical protein E7465_05425 [Ruminococcaceae bacterium]|nr:hypothetical protein [Oscillospiraceae bacterium]
MSQFVVDLSAMQNNSVQFQQVSDGLVSVQSSLDSIRREIARNLSIPIAVMNLMPDAIQKHINDVQKMHTALGEIIELYTQHETAALDNAVNGGAGNSGNGGAEPSDPTEGMTYEEILEYRAQNAVDENTRRLYEKYRDKIKIKDDDYQGTAHYNSGGNYIKYSDEDDAVNERGAGNTYFHEVGHLIDDRSDWNGDTSTDWSYDFYDCLQADVNNWLQRCMQENGYTDINDAYDALSAWLWDDPNMKNGISDLVTGLTEGNAGGRWAHDSDYYDSESIPNEAFAHFFEAGMCSDPTKLEYIREIFPTAYAEFQEMIQDELGD